VLRVVLIGVLIKLSARVIVVIRMTIVIASVMRIKIRWLIFIPLYRVFLFHFFVLLRRFNRQRILRRKLYWIKIICLINISRTFVTTNLWNLQNKTILMTAIIRWIFSRWYGVFSTWVFFKNETIVLSLVIVIVSLVVLF
jgi:hypothetical protein